jgi:hypothetical protein
MPPRSGRIIRAVAKYTAIIRPVAKTTAMIRPAAKAKAKAKAAAKGNGKGRGKGIIRPAAKAKGTGKGILHRPVAARVDPVFLNVATDAVTVHTLLFDGQDTFETVKIRLMHLLGWPLPANAITLHCGFHEMEGHRTLASYGIGMGHPQPYVITMVPEMPEEAL